MVAKHVTLAQTLLEAGLLSTEDLDRVNRNLEGETLLKALVKMKIVPEKDIALALAEKLGFPFVDLFTYNINLGAATLLSEEIARKYTVLPIAIEGNTLVIASADPTNVLDLDDLRVITGYTVKPVICTESAIEQAISKYSSMDKMVEDALDSVTPKSESEDSETGDEDEETSATEAPIIKLVDLILTEAVRSRAGDVHIEPQESEVKVRYRIDGVLTEGFVFPKKTQPGVISRLKIIAAMDIAERRLPQDGRFVLKVGQKNVDFRVASLPTIYGEKIVLRLLEKENLATKLEDLGFLHEEQRKFEQVFKRPYGAILVSGPSGSGKTTTLYVALELLNTPEKNLISVEDPVEYRLSGINQTQINPKAGLTFATGLRSILRNDPDVVMVGEIRDRETAQIAIESALTGHLVLSTIHTNDAPSAITRLTEMGVEPFLISSAVDCVVAQRLARRLCTRCKEPYSPSEAVLEEINLEQDPKETRIFYRPKGCSACGDTGYKGRIGLYEVLIVTEQIELLTIKHASSDEIREVAHSEGMKTLFEDGLEKVKQGLTSLEEIMRVAT
ncbi:MAG TPA: ATPase, T2SS/T4P/T4SS family [Candidatus Subteraquimicrobiales bacterium]